MKAELLSLEETFTPTGTLTIQARRSRTGHADRAMAFLMLARCEFEGLVPGSPSWAGEGLHVFNPYTGTELDT